MHIARVIGLVYRWTAFYSSISVNVNMGGSYTSSLSRMLTKSKYMRRGNDVTSILQLENHSGAKDSRPLLWKVFRRPCPSGSDKTEKTDENLYSRKNTADALKEAQTFFKTKSEREHPPLRLLFAEDHVFVDRPTMGWDSTINGSPNNNSLTNEVRYRKITSSGAGETTSISRLSKRKLGIERPICFESIIMKMTASDGGNGDNQILNLYENILIRPLDLDKLECKIYCILWWYRYKANDRSTKPAEHIAQQLIGNEEARKIVL